MRQLKEWYEHLKTRVRVCRRRLDGNFNVWLTFCVLDDLWVTGLHDCDTGVSGSKIDTNNAKESRMLASTFLKSKDLRGKVALSTGEE
jgi:hypothetical protein